MSRTIAEARETLLQSKSRLQQIFDLSEAGISLLDHNSDPNFQEPFLYSMFRWMEKVPTDQIPTAAVGYYKNRNAYVFFYNPWFMAKLGWTSKDDPTPCALGRKRQKAVILHELFHVHGRHLNERNLNGVFDSVLDNKEYVQEATNIAMDLAINSTLGIDDYLTCGLSPGGKEEPTPEELAKNPYAGFERAKSAEWYAAKMISTPEVLAKLQMLDRARTRAVKTMDELFNPSTCEMPTPLTEDPSPMDTGICQVGMSPVLA